MPGHRARDRVKVSGPSASRFELVVGFIEGCVAGGAGVHARVRRVFVIFATAGSFGSFLAQDSELFCLDVSQS